MAPKRANKKGGGGRDNVAASSNCAGGTSSGNNSKRRRADAPLSAPDAALAAVRTKMMALGLDAYIIGSEDAHQSEYVAARDARLQHISGFNGSAGTAVVTGSRALLWTDGRYFLQAEEQLSQEWTLMRSGEADVPALDDWLSLPDELPPTAVVGVDPRLVSSSTAESWKEMLSAGGEKRELRSVEVNLVDEVWGEDRPSPTSRPVRIHPLKYAGKSSDAKVEELRASIKKAGSSATLVTALDEVAWLFNIRSDDVQCTPVATAYALITSESATIYIDHAKFTGDGQEAMQYLTSLGVTIRPYEKVMDDLAAVVDSLEASKEKGDHFAAILLDPSKVSLAVSEKVPKHLLVSKASPIALAKAIKNESELAGLRACHIRDGAALTGFLAWLEEAVHTQPQQRELDLTEHTISIKLEEFRSAQMGYMGPSFPTIAGYGPNGAIIHYNASAETANDISSDSLFLLDSGGQYVDGTTDITRTVHFGTATPYQKRCFTLVLKGHIALATAIFPDGTMGSKLDILARLPLWQEGLDYRHGTGHGIGAHLGVHEGPQGIHFRIRANEQGLTANMTTSNEPGYYEEGSFGIRIENICVCVKQDTPSGKLSCRLETISLAPIQLDLVDASLLTYGECKWLDGYHAEVQSKLAPLLKESDARAYRYLMKHTQPLLEMQKIERDSSTEAG
jgi:Xaa-Pro aminopeptidase